MTFQEKESVKWIAEKGKYNCGLPYKYGREKTAEILNKVESKSMAERRMWSLKISFEKVPAKKEKGFSEMHKFLEKGRYEKLSEEEKNGRRKKAFQYGTCHVTLSFRKASKHSVMTHAHQRQESSM